MSKSLVGIVDKVIDNRTISVIVSRRVPHPLYKKVVKISKKYLVDKEAMHVVNAGSFVEIRGTRPISKRKAWKVVVN